MTRFRRALAERQTDPTGRRWIFVPYDQFSAALGPLSREDPQELGILLVENPWKAARRPYHKQKLALVLANLRHFALEQAERGVAVRHVVVNGPYRVAVEAAVRDLGPLRMMRAAERELRVDLQPLAESGALSVIPHEGWLTTPEQFRASHPNGPPWLMERFYRLVRQSTGILMAGGKPEGGKYNYDAENRSPYKNGPPAPEPPRFSPDEITIEVGELIEKHFHQHPGSLSLEDLPATPDHANRQWEWAKAHCLPNFGKYEDAMSTRSSGLFHTRISPLLNIHRLLPRTVVTEAARLDIPLAGKEGFIRQILGWREFVRHVHEETDGFRKLPSAPEPPGEAELDAGAAPSALGAGTPLPAAYWGNAPSGMKCLDTVVANVWRDGWSHHITRLMILSNLATLLDVSPRELTDWFWVAYIDAYDWVVEPNVLGMGTFGVGQLFTTKPYVSGANYIRRMSDYCDGCQFDPKTTCPFSPLYWAFLQRHRDLLEPNARLALAYRALDARLKSGVRTDLDSFIQIRDTLVAGRPLGITTPAGQIRDNI